MPRKSLKSSVRIIGGQWRSRRLPVIDAPGLRPSGDRVRETLFNWLQHYLPGTVCADLYAGTGALGFEAASRSARQVTLIEKDTGVAAQLANNVELLSADGVKVFTGDATTWLEEQTPESLDLVFVDPPFEEQSQESVLQIIGQTGCIKPGGLVYVESSAVRPAPVPPVGWTTWREKIVGEVRMQVFAAPTHLERVGIE